MAVLKILKNVQLKMKKKLLKKSGQLVGKMVGIMGQYYGKLEVISINYLAELVCEEVAPILKH